MDPTESSTAAASAAAAAGGSGETTTKKHISGHNPEIHGPKNHLRISLGKNKFNFIDLTKYLLNEGEPYVELSGMGEAIASVVEIGEILKFQGLVDIISIETSRAPERPNGIQVDRIKVRVAKADTFAKVFVEQMEEKKKRKETEMAEKKAVAAAAAAATVSVPQAEGSAAAAAGGGAASLDAASEGKQEDGDQSTSK